MPLINTGKCTDRRTLRFSTIADLRADLDAIERAERAGTLRRIGNWTVGQTCGHLATWAEFLYTGVPISPPWFIRIILKRRKHRYLNEGLPAGVHIPRVPNGTLGTEVMTLDAGLARYRDILARVEREPPTKDSPLFGPLTHEEGIKSQLRHAELHLSFLHPQ
ncbi:MAG: DUF1569 domain-containing protein [Dehalococcoidia bacterium]